MAGVRPLGSSTGGAGGGQGPWAGASSLPGSRSEGDSGVAGSEEAPRGRAGREARPSCRVPWLQLLAAIRFWGACPAPKRVTGAGNSVCGKAPGAGDLRAPEQSANTTGDSPVGGGRASLMQGPRPGCALQCRASGSVLPQWRGARAGSESGPSPALRLALWAGVRTWAHGRSSRTELMGTWSPAAGDAAHSSTASDPHDLRPCQGPTRKS